MKFKTNLINICLKNDEFHGNPTFCEISFALKMIDEHIDERCRTRKMLNMSIYYLFTKIGVDTTENEHGVEV